MKRLNLGCGFAHEDGYVNVDAFEVCKPDEVVNLDQYPWPWEDNSVDEILMLHTLEHLQDWWGAILECVRILKPGGMIHIHVPDESSSTALTYRDHHHVFHYRSFHGIQKSTHGSSAWAAVEEDKVPLMMVDYYRVPFKQYEWMFKRPFRWLGEFCAEHMRNFIWEQQFHLQKVGK